MIMKNGNRLIALVFAMTVAFAPSCGSPSAPSPVVGISVSPGGAAIINATRLSFSAGVTDLTSPSVSWSFGDGNTGSGQATDHIYTTEGNFIVTVTATGRTATATASTTVVARSVTGVWLVRITHEGNTTEDRYTIRQESTRLRGRFERFQLVGGNRVLEGQGQIDGTVADPRQAKIIDHSGCPHELTAAFDSSLSLMVGTMCGIDGPDQEPGCRDDCWGPITFVRQ